MTVIETPPDAVRATLARQREFFATGRTKDVDFRLQQLANLEQALRRNEGAILDALKADLNKPPLEAYAAEVGLAIEEVKHIRKHLRGWARPKRMPGHWVQFPSSAWVYPEPYGVALVMGPWNFPFLLVMAPLIGMLSAGNCAIVKPSELSPHTSRLLARLMQDVFDPGLVSRGRGRRADRAGAAGREIRLPVLHRRGRGRRGSSCRPRRAT